MTNAEYRQLIEFLGQKFGEVDRRFTDVNRQLDDLRRDLAIVADGLSDDRQDLAEFRDETRREFTDVKALIRASYATLDHRVRRLEGER